MAKEPGFVYTVFVLTGLVVCMLAGCDSKTTKNEPAVKPTEVTDLLVSSKDSLQWKKPTIRWEKLMSEGADFYTSEDILASNKLLDKYLADLSIAKDTADIWKAVEQVVSGFDKLSLKSDFIETGEREELAEFIQMAAEVYGLKYEGDITEQWRMEW
jgi:hypothetical protein